MASKPRSFGFTLIELLVAISVMAIVAVLGWRGLDGIVRARLALNEQLDETRGLQLAFAQLQNDCAQIADTGNVGSRKTLLTEPNRLVMIRMVFAENQPSRVQVVTYRLQNGVLSRHESVPTRSIAAIDAAWKSATTDLELPGEVALQKNVSLMALQTWFRNTAGWRNDNGDPDSGTPIGLEMSLQLTGQAGRMTKVFLMGAI